MDHETIQIIFENKRPGIVDCASESIKEDTQDPVSISNKTSFLKISQSLAHLHFGALLYVTKTYIIDTFQC